MEDLFEFRPIQGYEGLYSVNQSNQVKSHERIIIKSNKVIQKVNEKILVTNIMPSGHLVVALCKKNCTPRTYGIHVLVAIAWNLTKEHNHTVVKHLDNNPANNIVSNLQYDTNRQNILDSVNDGLKAYQKGESAGNVKLKEIDVLFIRESLLSTLMLAKKYNVSVSTIRGIKTRLTWKHI